MGEVVLLLFVVRVRSAGRWVVWVGILRRRRRRFRGGGDGYNMIRRRVVTAGMLTGASSVAFDMRRQVEEGGEGVQGGKAGCGL